MSEDKRLLLTVDEAAQRLGVARSHLYRFVQSGELPSIRIGRSRRVPVAMLERFVAERLEDAEGASS